VIVGGRDYVRIPGGRHLSRHLSPGGDLVEKVFGIVLHGEVKLDRPLDWEEGTRVEVSACAPASTSGNGSHDVPAGSGNPRTGVRAEFLRALNANEYGKYAEELGPLSSDETELLIAHMDAKERVFESDAEFEAFQEFLRASRAEQKELVRRQWETEERLF
jgi:hypothetical protein